MADKKPHISLPAEKLVKRVLDMSPESFDSWPESVRNLALSLAGELFIIRYNPFINPDLVQKSVWSRLNTERSALSPQYFQEISSRLDAYWQTFEEDREFKGQVIKNLSRRMPPANIVTTPNTIIECSTDATDLRMELPMMVLFPENTSQIRAIVQLANEMNFTIVPRGGGSGLTGGAIPAMRLCVILSLSRMKEILEIDKENHVLCAQSGVITLDAIKAAARENLLFTVDPASKAASSLGGNVSENAGGPFAFEYGTTIDNILSYKMVLANGELLDIKRANHPGHKILLDETAEFHIFDEHGRLKETIRLSGEDIRSPGLGKDVTNKFLGGLPGIQKEGVDGVITEACFTLHPTMALSRVLCLEFYGHSMRNAMLVIKDIVGLRDKIRINGDLVKISALEEFGTKYVQAIEYRKKSAQYEGEPISVLIVQLDSNDALALDQAVESIVDIVSPYDQVDVFVARDAKEAEIFWEDRHKLSAITRRTSGFKINEDIVIPLDVIPEFSDFIENLNLYYLALAYRKALNTVLDLQQVDMDDEFIHMELDIAMGVLKGKTTKDDLPEEIFHLQIGFFFQDLKGRYPELRRDLESILDELNKTKIIVANHMHAGDGNCHVNIPVNSNDPEMMHLAEDAAQKVFAKVLELKGQVSGEHGIGITKIGFLSDDKIAALKAYKKKIDPRNVFNPGKLIQKDLPVHPYTFSFNQLIEDLNKTGLEEKDRLINLLRSIQSCSRCGKCKQTCPMYLPQKGLLFHPRNKNIAMGALIEAIYYTQLLHGDPDQEVVGHLRRIMEHCTACGKCTQACPVKIENARAALEMRSFLDINKASGHPVKNRILKYLSQDPQKMIPRAAKLAGIGQRIQNTALGIVPSFWRKKLTSPLFRDRSPEIGFRNLPEALRLGKHHIFRPENKATGEAVFYFPGCGGGLFYRDIGLASLVLLLEAGRTVILPDKHLCCGYPLLAGGCLESYEKIKADNRRMLQQLINSAKDQGLTSGHILTSCGTCREGIHDYRLKTNSKDLGHLDIVQYLLQETEPKPQNGPEKILYHPACHAEWVGVNLLKAGEVYASKLGEFLGSKIELSPGCCGESGLGAMTSPEIYNLIRARKQEILAKQLPEYNEDFPLLVGCPSCKIGISRSLMELKSKRKVLHTVEYLAQTRLGKTWKNDFLKKLSKSRIQEPVLYYS
ncbi:FAD-binding and (Fe-S)-binding domain-containing protein [Desulfonatronovibrio hydrogenovorans]|uniref:FAD-binding and (Fe-S)-binding domain-containing protein n=1 Tax=Desulfonatronovibrio hydrogenovorans TaxID=53245 RepID=UPI00048F3DF6|nr:FAD-binding and (Fe-S)-binding domain-containing protein [Desulfonatronovibrio hydrogenovorans]